jgi:hypothetical protein
VRAILLAPSLVLAGCSLDAIGAFEATVDGGAGGGAGSGTTAGTVTATTGSGGGAGEVGGAGGGSTSSGQPTCARRGAWLDGSPESYLEYDPGSNDVMTNSMPSAFVFSIWLKPDFTNFTVGRRFLAGRVDEGNEAGWSLHLEPNGRVVAKVRHENAGVCEIGGVPTSWPARIRLRYLGGQQDAMRLFANEVPIATEASCENSPILAATSVPFRVGFQPDPELDDALPYRGEVDDVFYDGSDNAQPPCTGNARDRGWNFEESLEDEVLPALLCVGNLVLVGGAMVTGVDCIAP